MLNDNASRDVMRLYSLLVKRINKNLKKYGDTSPYCAWGHSRMAMQLGLPEDQIIACLVTLEESNIIRIARRDGTTNRYYILSDRPDLIIQESGDLDEDDFPIFIG